MDSKLRLKIGLKKQEIPVYPVKYFILLLIKPITKQNAQRFGTASLPEFWP